MENAAYRKDSADPRDPRDLPPPYSEFSLVEGDMKALRDTLDPTAFNAPLSQGHMTPWDMYKLFFLIACPSFFFILAIVIMAVDDN